VGQFKGEQIGGRSVVNGGEAKENQDGEIVPDYPFAMIEEKEMMNKVVVTTRVSAPDCACQEGTTN
jgi:hypothetical protein